MSDPNDRLRRRYARLAPGYDRQMVFWERVLLDGGRRWACSRAKGDVLEIAVGTGRNLPYYAEDVRVTGVDLSPDMLQIARRRADELGRPVELRVGDAQQLEFPDGSFDTVVCTLGLCTIPRPRASVDEAKRVLRAGGRLVLLEHVASPSMPVRLVQRLLDPMARLLGGDHLVREPLDDVLAAGFEIEELRRAKVGIMERVVGRKP